MCTHMRVRSRAGVYDKSLRASGYTPADYAETQHLRNAEIAHKYRKMAYEARGLGDHSLSRVICPLCHIFIAVSWDFDQTQTWFVQTRTNQRVCAHILSLIRINVCVRTYALLLESTCVCAHTLSVKYTQRDAYTHTRSLSAS